MTIMVAVRVRGIVLAALLMGGCGSGQPSGDRDAAAGHAGQDASDAEASSGGGAGGQAGSTPQDGAAGTSDAVEAAQDDAAVRADGAAGDAPQDVAGVQDAGPSADGVSSDGALTEASPDVSSGPPSCAPLGVSLTTTKASYKDTDRLIDVIFSGLRGAGDDMLTFEPPDYAAGTTQQIYVVPKDQTGAYPKIGETTFLETRAGTYVVRYQRVSTFDVICQSAPITIYTPTPTTVTTDKSTYVSGQSITVTFMNLPNGGVKWLYLAVKGSPADKQVGFAPVNDPSGTYGLFTAPAPGDYVIRAIGNGPVLLAESASFTVTPKPMTN